MSNDETAAVQAWKIHVASSLTNSYILEGGVNHWIAFFGKDDKERLRVNKHNEPRTHMLVSNAAKAALLGCELGLPNIGAYLDFGHALMSREIPAKSVAMLTRLGRLVGVHVNDTYGTGDDDMAVGAVHFWAMVEFLLELERSGYDGWLTLDLVPKRESAVAACTRSIANMKNYLAMISKLDLSKLDDAQADQDAMQSQRLVQDLLAIN